MLHITFDILTTVFMLTFCTRAPTACLRLLSRRRLWWFQLFHPRSSVVLAFPVSVARTRHEVTSVQEIQPPALSGCLLNVLCLAASNCKFPTTPWSVCNRLTCHEDPLISCRLIESTLTQSRHGRQRLVRLQTNGLVSRLQARRPTPMGKFLPRLHGN